MYALSKSLGTHKEKSLPLRNTLKFKPKSAIGFTLVLRQAVVLLSTALSEDNGFIKEKRQQLD